MEPNMQGTTMNLGANVQNNVQQPVMNNNVEQPQQPVMNTSGYSQPVVNNVPQQPVFNETTVMNTQQPQQPVFTQTVAGQPQNIQLNTQPVQQVAQPVMQTIPTEQQANNISAQSVQATLQNEPVVTQEQPQVAVQEQVQKPQHQITDKVIMDVKDLQKLVSQAKQIANDENLVPISQIYYLVVNKDGFRIFASNDAQVLDVVDTTYSYTQEFQIAINSKKFTDLVMNLDPGTVEFTFNEQQKILTLTTETGRFQFTEQADMSTGFSLTIDHKFKMDYNSMQTVDFEGLLDTIIKSKPIRTLANSMQQKGLNGVFFTKGLTLSTDSNLIFMQQAVQGFLDKDLGMSSALADLLTSLTFDNSNVRFGLVTGEIAQGVNVQGIVFTDGKVTISSPLIEQLDQSIIDVCMNFWNVDYNAKIVFDTKKIISILKRVSPFIEMGTDDDSVLYQFNGNTTTIESLGGSGLDTLYGENPGNYNGNFKLQVQRTLKVLGTITDSTFNLTINPQDLRSVCFSYGQYKCVASVSA